MPRKYTRKPGSRSYKNYTSSDLLKAVEDAKRKSIYAAAKKYNIPYGTLHNKVNGRHDKPNGGQVRLSHELECELAKVIDILADWKIPIGKLEIRTLVKDHLDNNGVHVFQDNMPGSDWLRTFMKRHNLTKRVSANISRKRATISSKSINDYFNHLSIELLNVPPQNIFNYDETNLREDPGLKEVIVRRGYGRVERIMEDTKSCTSVMFCGDAAGNYLPPMVVYKSNGQAEKSWKIGGPKGALYECTKSGWFNMETFSKWFFSIFLPWAKEISGTKALIGDNLASHFSANVIEATLMYDIKFITLPANSTHLLQPLDVSVFSSLKKSWRVIIQGWRLRARASQSVNIPKNHFPGLLNELTNYIHSDLLQSGFRKTGIYPMNRNEVLRELPGERTKLYNSDLNDSVLSLLQAHVGENSYTNDSKRRSSKPTPGKRITYKPKIYTCTCKEIYDDNNAGERWIQCSECKLEWAHLECSGIDFEEEEYLDKDFSDYYFQCKKCKP